MALIDVSPPPRRSRRRAMVFCCAFLPALAASLTYVYSRPAEYRVVARLKIAPSAAVTQPAAAKDTPTVTTDAKSFLTEVQALTSRPLLQDVFGRLQSDGPVSDLGPDPIDAMQRMLRAEPIAGTQVVELSAEGHQQGLIAPLVNTVIDVYRQHVTDAYKGGASSTYGELNDEVSALAKEVSAKRQAIDAFRARFDIVSMEHTENEVLAKIKGLTQSYTDANERRAKAQARLQALRNSAAAGKSVVRSKDDPTLAAIEQRAMVLREQWRDLQRRFTADYIAINPDAKSIQARLESLEEQLKTQKVTSERAALAEAEEEASAAQATVERLRQNVSENQKQAQEFATHLNEYKTLRADLDHLEEMHRAALDRLTKLQASERERAPRVELLEAAATSREPWRPNYRQDALIGLAGSFVFGLFATWFAEFIAGPREPPAMVMQHLWSPMAALARGTPNAPLSLIAPGVAQLPAPMTLPRELADAEIAALVASATDDARLAVVALLMGVSAEELVALRWDEIDLSIEAIHVSGGATVRLIPLQDPLRSLFVARQHADPDGSGTVLHTAQGARLAIEEVERLVLLSAYDAGLDRPQEVTPDALRYTYLSFLLRQGLRAADIPSVMGHVPHRELVVYMQIHSPKARRPLDQIDRLLPALHKLAGDGIG